MDATSSFDRALHHRMLVFLIISLMFGLFLSACAGSGESRNGLAFLDVAKSGLPGVRTLPHHPDSLMHLSLGVEGSDTILTVGRQWSPLEAWKQWSTGGAFEGGPIASSVRSSPGRISSFATLQSLELTLASLAQQVDSTTALSEGDALRKRLKAHRDHVRIDYCRFDIRQDLGHPFEKQIDEHGYKVLLENNAGQRRVAERIELRRRGTAVRSYRTEYMPFTSRPDQLSENDPEAHYRCYAMYFKREVDGVDILDGFTKLTFWPRHSPKRDSYYTWTLPPSLDLSAKQRD